MDGLAERGVALESLAHDLSIPTETLLDPKQEIPWDDFVILLERFGRLLGDPEKLREIGAAHVGSESMSLFLQIGRALSRPKDLYMMGAYWMGPSLFPMIRGELWERSDGRLVERLQMQRGYRDSPELFYILHGALEVAPQYLGHPRSEVELRLEPGVATYTIAPAVTGHSLIGHLVRALRAPFTVPRMMNELFTQQAAIQAGYSEMESARGRIEAQAGDLERVDSIGRRLSEHIDIDRVTDILVQVMLTDIGAAGVELWLIRPDDALAPAPGNDPSSASSSASSSPATQSHPEARVFRRGGLQEGSPSFDYLLETASRPVGRLKVWIADQDADGAHSELLSRLLPWIAMSLDNARSYEALELHASDLEQRVKERTARLLSANHHLVKEIGERKKATDALIHSEAQLRSAERLASVGTLAAGIAHEINNPIGSILAAAQLALIVQNSPGEEADVERALEDIIAQAKRCGGIVRSVLQFSRDERTEKWVCRVEDILLRSIRLTSAFAAEHRANIHLAPDESSAWARVNPIQVEQAIVNLLRNAIESGGREVVIRTVDEPESQKVRIEITDDGPGIPEADRHRVFEPFFTTKRSDGGTGLGLSVVHGIATEHGGSLEIRPSDERGTVVIFWLPTVPPPPVPLEDKPSEETTLDPASAEGPIEDATGQTPPPDRLQGS